MALAAAGQVYLWTKPGAPPPPPSGVVQFYYRQYSWWLIAGLLWEYLWQRFKIY